MKPKQTNSSIKIRLFVGIHAISSAPSASNSSIRKAVVVSVRPVPVGDLLFFSIENIEHSMRSFCWYKTPTVHDRVAGGPYSPANTAAWNSACIFLHLSMKNERKILDFMFILGVFWRNIFVATNETATRAWITYRIVDDITFFRVHDQ